MIAFFPGQGSQFVGMGKDLYNDFPVAKQTFEEASDALKLNVSKLCFEGPESDLTLTENTQPCLLTTSVAAFRVAQMEFGFKPAAVAGHSLGEYSALVAAGSLQLAVAVRWVKERGAAMQRAVPAGEGTMAAVLGLEDEKVTTICEAATKAAIAKRSSGETPTQLSVEAIVQPANFNAPGQVVIAGSTDAVATAVELIKAGTVVPGGKAIPLQVSAPFHCTLMSPARDRMAQLFADTQPDHRPKPLACPYVPNRTARLTQEPGLVFELLTEQVDHPVLWRQSIVTFLQAGHTVAIEFGPGKVLQGLAKRISFEDKTLKVTSCGSTENIRTFESL
ncbi:ACP S-malonyltransferase [bacterium]|jgi:[acyl-carrier-protein] S-malonyltransferase|nr:ACP S-malonyltransferase [bacterium]